MVARTKEPPLLEASASPRAFVTVPIWQRLTNARSCRSDEDQQNEWTWGQKLAVKLLQGGGQGLMSGLTLRTLGAGGAISVGDVISMWRNGRR